MRQGGREGGSEKERGREPGKEEDKEKWETKVICYRFSKFCSTKKTIICLERKI